MGVHVRRERPQRRLRHPDGPVGVAAGAAAGDLPEPALHAVKRVSFRPRGGELCEIVGDRRQAEHARPALLRALGGQEAKDAGGLREPAAGGTWPARR